MFKHLDGMRYLLLHKWYVLIAGLRIGVPLWRLIIHDWTKFLPCEWFAYVNYFHSKPKCQEQHKQAFVDAWTHHWNWNRHHWQWWCRDSFPVQMEHVYIKEMVADWIGAGKAQANSKGVKVWYEENKTNIGLHTETRRLVEHYIELYGD